MCWDCGCFQPTNSHGDSRHITTETLRSAAAANETDVPTVVANITHTLALHRGRQRASKELGGEREAVAGTVLKADDEKRFLLLVAYSANKMPARGADGYIDVASPEVLEKACWRFMDNGARVGLYHEPGHDGAARVVENYVYRNEVPWVMKAPDGSTQTVMYGDWVVGVICSKDTWNNYYKAGMIGGASPQGRAGRRLASEETLARMRSIQ